jgi:hypothetical protein
LHKYLYSTNDPVNQIDPSGNSTILEKLTVGAIISVLSIILFDANVPVYAPESKAPRKLTIDERVVAAQEEEEKIVLETLFHIAVVLLSHTRILGGGKGPTPSRSGSPQLGDPPYVIRYNPSVPGRPDPDWSIDTAAYAIGEATERGGVRNRSQFWRDWLNQKPETLSPSNRYRIESLMNPANPRVGPSPTVDDTWISHFPEHAPFKGEVIIHHHVEQGRYAIPVPAPTHVGSGGPFHGFPPPNP